MVPKRTPKMSTPPTTASFHPAMPVEGCADGAGPGNGGGGGGGGADSRMCSDELPHRLQNRARSVLIEPHWHVQYMGLQLAELSHVRSRPSCSRGIGRRVLPMVSGLSYQ